MKQTHRKTTVQHDLNKTTLKLYWNLPYARMCLRNFVVHPHNISQENISGGLLLYVQIILKDSNYKKLLFTAVKRNLLTLRNKEINK